MISITTPETPADAPSQATGLNKDLEKPDPSANCNCSIGDQPQCKDEKTISAGAQDFEQTNDSVEQSSAIDLNEGGFDGWKAVIGCALVAGPTIGWNLLWGVFQIYHSRNFLKGTSDATLSAIGAIQGALLTGLPFVTGKLGDKYGYKRFISAGCVTVFLGQFCASFCDDLWSIFLTQGVMHGLGCGLLVPMLYSIPSQWFRKRRGVATGIFIAGSSVGSAVSSLVVQAMLENLGFRKTMLIYSLVQGVIMLIGFLLIKTRLPTSQINSERRKIQWVDMQRLKDPVFWSFAMALLFVVLGWMTPLFFISTYAQEKLPQISAQLASLPISVITFSSAIGRTSIGIIGDRIGYVNAFILVVLASSFSQSVLWNVTAGSYAGIIVFSVFYGLSGPSFVSLITPVAVTLYGTHNLATLTGLLHLFHMPGHLAGAPIGGVILASSGRNWHALSAYSGLAQFTGVLCILYTRFTRKPKLWAKF